ncbi:hypothetical protein O6072_09280 [Mycolicibacterium neoaurum]|uniref:hypothetical protein n=1 Tax=Mycolicibacterium neoaurum TaxID=1795 RepID=UPI00248AEACB|nr:hypothetical protein [Mycolicibacterium neoaurum]WBP96452.1 hypothetical protein O7W24_09905 [Mycolicibacterium neoaurum]WBS10017.1 hypothetical protein O6072_09280 [Mycolicibacterium neoaurum]
MPYSAEIAESMAHRLMQPAQNGGGGLTPDEFLCTVIELGTENASRGWVAAAYGLGAQALPATAFDVVWSEHPDARVTVAFGGSALVDGNRLNGRWPSVVGALEADWFLLGAAVGCVLLPAAAVRVHRNQHDGGLPASGLADVDVADVDMTSAQMCPHRTAADAVLATAVAAAAVVGSALGGWQRHVDALRAQLAISHGGDVLTDQAAAQIARTASDLDASRIQITTSGFTRRAPYAQAMARSRAAMDQLLASSRHALDVSDPVTTAWRDVHAGCRLAAGYH